MKRRVLAVCVLAMAFGAFATQARANRDEVQFGSPIHVARDSSIHDAVCFFCDVDADGTVEGDIVVFFGDIHIGTSANHDVVNFFGSIKADNNAHIGNDMVSMFGNIRLGEEVSVGKDMVAMFGSACMVFLGTADDHRADHRCGGRRVSQASAPRVSALPDAAASLERNQSWRALLSSVQGRRSLGRADLRAAVSGCGLWFRCSQPCRLKECTPRSFSLRAPFASFYLEAAGR